MQANIRSAEPADLGALIDLENRSFSADRISRPSLRRLIVSRSTDVLVAAALDSVAGYAVILYRAGSGLARLYSLAVDPEFGGLGRQLLAVAEAAAARRGCRALRLEVRDDNLRAINLYRRAEYRPIGEVPGYYSDGATALRFEKQLAVPSNTVRAARGNGCGMSALPPTDNSALRPAIAGSRREST
jgi:[ribosomal protein S18]-alanine N-acetyltransferase